MRTKVALTTILGLLGGYVDVICFVRYGVFAATMTGNLVFIGRSLLFFFVDCPSSDTANSARLLCVDAIAEGVAFRFAVLLSHLMGVAAMVALQRHVEPRRAAALAAPGDVPLTPTRPLFDTHSRTRLRSPLSPLRLPPSPPSLPFSTTVPPQ